MLLNTNSKNLNQDIITLVDHLGNILGPIDKIEAHKNGGKLHRAFSIFIFDKEGNILIQKRSKNKYHSGGLWTNTCCSHPLFGEDIHVSLHRRLKEEMGFDCELKELYSFIYKVDIDESLTEHELDSIFIGKISNTVTILPNPEEVEDYRWVNFVELQKDIATNPETYTKWFKIIMNDSRMHQCILYLSTQK